MLAILIVAITLSGDRSGRDSPRSTRDLVRTTAGVRPVRHQTSPPGRQSLHPLDGTGSPALRGVTHPHGPHERGDLDRLRLPLVAVAPQCALLLADKRRRVRLGRPRGLLPVPHRRRPLRSNAAVGAAGARGHNGFRDPAALRIRGIGFLLPDVLAIRGARGDLELDRDRSLRSPVQSKTSPGRSAWGSLVRSNRLSGSWRCSSSSGIWRATSREAP